MLLAVPTVLLRCVYGRISLPQERIQERIAEQVVDIPFATDHRGNAVFFYVRVKIVR